MRIQCLACLTVKLSEKQYCPECKGLGFFDIYKKCSQQSPECPIEGESMTGGWMCNKCGNSGPL